ncbi:hypothetical protein O6H91_Y288200 [Diphasiastrum complanatum]|nr:hypothetical protein O6H91_Y288200 [Diphasiastrum complanatum]
MKLENFFLYLLRCCRVKFIYMKTMPPKTAKDKQLQSNQKSNKKELKALKKKEKERKKEEARKAAEEKARQEEVERQRLAEEVRLEWAAEQARLKAEHDRIVEERKSLQPIFTSRATILANLQTEELGIVDWERFVETSALPFAGDEPSMNGFISMMQSSFDMDLNTALESAIRIYTIFSNTEELALMEDQKKNNEELSKYRHYMERLEDLACTRLDNTTAHLLERSHEYWKQTGESTQCVGKDDWKLALWVNHGKNPRFRTLEFPSISTFLTLPKQFALANLALRLYHQIKDPLYRSTNSYMSL